MKILIELVTVEGQVILEPFAGSVPVAVAAKMLDRASIAIEMNEGHCEVIRSRLDANELPTTLEVGDFYAKVLNNTK